MPTLSSHANDPGVSGPLGSLALSFVTPLSSTMALRAAGWQRELERLGVVLPFAFVHDIGLLFAAPQGQVRLGERCDVKALLANADGAVKLLLTYHEVLRGISESEVAQRARGSRRSDALVTALLARVLGPVARRIRVGRPYPIALPADARAFELTRADLASLWAGVDDRGFELESLAAIGKAKLFVLTLADALDLDTLQLIDLLGLGRGAGPSIQVDLLAALNDPSSHDVVSFSLDILPSVLETKTRPAASTHAAFGYSGLGRRGTVDSLVLTELAWDADEFLRRMLDDEVFYYTRDQAHDEVRRTHHLVIDASASMRGDRATFARGLALATAKKLVLAGEDVAFRFFDARLYDLVRANGRELPTPYVLSFKGERGRNPTRVFTTLANELAMVRQREGREPIVHLFTHGAHDVPRPLVAAVRAHARLSAVFIAPRGGTLDLEYLDLLDAHWLVTNQTIGEKGARAETARAILGEVRPEGGAPRAEGAPPSSRSRAEGPSSSRSRGEGLPSSRRGQGLGRRGGGGA